MYQDYLSEIDRVPLFPMWLIVLLSVIVISFFVLAAWFLLYDPLFDVIGVLQLLLMMVLLCIGAIFFNFVKTK